MRSQPRTTEEAATLLHCSANDADAVLWGMGFAFEEETGIWVWAGDREAAILARCTRARPDTRQTPV